VCDLETSRMGAPYIYDISRLRVKQALRGRWFTTDQQLDVTVHAWLVSQPRTFYSEAIKQIVL